MRSTFSGTEHDLLKLTRQTKNNSPLERRRGRNDEGMKEMGGSERKQSGENER